MNTMQKKPRDSILLRVRVTTNMKADRLCKEGTILWAEVRVTAERNQANLRVRELVAAQEGVPLAAVRIIKGHRSFSKLLQVVKR